MSRNIGNWKLEIIPRPPVETAIYRVSATRKKCDCRNNKSDAMNWDAMNRRLYTTNTGILIFPLLAKEGLGEVLNQKKQNTPISRRRFDWLTIISAFNNSSIL